VRSHPRSELSFMKQPRVPLGTQNARDGGIEPFRADNAGFDSVQQVVKRLGIVCGRRAHSGLLPRDDGGIGGRAVWRGAVRQGSG